MGLRESRIINSVHPWLGARLQWLSEVARIIGSNQILSSGNRTRGEQLALYNDVRVAVVAYPGCSQHQYGFAADANYLPAANITSKGRGLLETQAATDRFMQSAAHHVNLTTVNQDPGHLQVYPGNQFRNWAVARGFCNPNPPPRNFPESFPLVGGTVDRYCGTGFTGIVFRPTGFTCLPERFITSLPGE